MMSERIGEESLAGRTLRGKYRIESPIGRGGMGSVWAGVHVRTGRKVAIKILDQRFLTNNGVVQRFGREARAASAIQHPGIVEVLDLDQTEAGVPFLVMERLAGETLAKRIERRGRLGERETVEICKQLLEALDAAHKHGVVHRDLKPDNVFLVPRAGSEAVKILDFGISQKEDERISALTVEGSVLGTPHYMAPEQALGEINIDGRADLYALGVVLYECLTGDVPFDAPNYNKLIQVILNQAPKPPSERGVALSASFESALMRLLQKKPAARYQSAGEMLAVLSGAPVPEPLPVPVERDRGRKTSPSADDLVIEFGEKKKDDKRPSRRNIPVAHSAMGDELADAGPNDKLEIDERALSVPPRRSLRSPATSASSSQPPREPISSKPPRASTSGSFSAAPSEPIPSWYRKKLIWIAVLSIACGAAVVVVAPWGDPSSVRPPPSEREPDELTEAPPQYNTVLIEIDGLPPGARLRLDGLPAGSSPLRLRREDRTYSLEIAAPGFDTRVVNVTADRDQRVRGALRPTGGGQ
jgi:eukaryotic-like serine/threonine-protein kinase